MTRPTYTYPLLAQLVPTAPGSYQNVVGSGPPFTSASATPVWATGAPPPYSQAPDNYAGGGAAYPARVSLPLQSSDYSMGGKPGERCLIDSILFRVLTLGYFVTTEGANVYPGPGAFSLTALLTSSLGVVGSAQLELEGYQGIGGFSGAYYRHGGTFLPPSSVEADLTSGLSLSLTAGMPLPVALTPSTVPPTGIGFGIVVSVETNPSYPFNAQVQPTSTRVTLAGSVVNNAQG